MYSRRISNNSAKPKRTRGRIALPGVDLRDLVPVGCSESELVAKKSSL